MGIDLRRLDEDMRRLGLVKQVMSDPIAVDIIRELLGQRNGSGHRPTANHPTPTSDENNSVSKTRGAIRSQVGEFMLASLAKTLPEMDKKALGKILAYLVKNGEIRVVRREGRSNIYTKTEKLRV